MKRTLALLVALIMLTGLLAGCQPKPSSAPLETSNPTAGTQTQAPQPSDSTNEEQTPEEFTVDWYVNLSWWAWNGLGWGQDLVSQTIKEKTGVNINFITPASDGGEQLSTMIASDALPDIITLQGLWDGTDRMLAYQLAMDGYLTSYDELIELNPKLGEVARQDVLDWYRENDGKAYMYPNYAYSSQDIAPGEKLAPNRMISIRQDLWKAIGSPEMSTPSDFLAAVAKVKSEVGTYDGKDIIGIQLYEGANEALSIMNQYFATPTENADGTLAYQFDMEGTRESLAFLNEAYRMGLITEANFSDTRDMINEKVASGRVFAMVTAPQDFINQLGTLYDADSEAVYQHVVLRNSKGEDPVLSDLSGWGWLMTGVSSEAENKEQIAKLIEYLLSDEGQILTTYGVEGVTFNYNADGTISMSEQYLQDTNANDAKKYAVGAMNLFGNYAFTRRFDSLPTDAKALATNDVVMKTPMSEYSYNFSAAGGKEDPSDPRKTEMSELNVRISTFTKTAIAELITANSEEAFNAKFDEVKATLEQMGARTLNDYNNEWFQVGKEAMGLDFIWPAYQK